MNEKVIKNLEDRITFLEEKCSDLKKNITALSIDKQLYVKNNKVINSGIACKVSFDNHGVITGTHSLNINDIPQLDMDHIAGLYDALNAKASVVDVNKMKKEFENYKDSNKITDTATKVNIDKYGKVVSTAQLLPEDIPTLPVEKIKGLKEFIEINDNKSSSNIAELPDVTNGGTSCKVTYDSKGRIVDSSKLTIDDLPMELITRLNVLEGNIMSLASSQAVKTLQNELNNKVTSNPSIVAGEYTKLVVDDKGLVTYGDKLTADDLPVLNVDNINGLIDMMNKKVNVDIVNDIKVVLSSLQSTVDKLPSNDELNNIIDSKVSKTDLNVVKNELTQLTSTISNLLNVLDVNKINDCIKDLYEKINTFNDRLVSLEVNKN